MDDLEIAAYYFPQWHPDLRNDKWHGKAWTEWELVKAAVPRYEGHRQPIKPAWGYFDESDPMWSAREIDLAADHGLTAFIYDYYWYADGAFLNGALDKGFLQAPNSHRLKFALMWANHDWHNLHPNRLNDGASDKNSLIGGTLDSEGFVRLTTHVIHEYFSRPNYLRLAGKPYFSIYDIATFIKGFGGLDTAGQALESFREACQDGNGTHLHLNAVVSRFGADYSKREIVQRLGIDSVTAYNWCDHYPIQHGSFPQGSYEKAMLANVTAWPGIGSEYGAPYIANLTTGWDSSPRCCTTDRYENRGYPWLPVLEGNTPEMFARSLEMMKDYLREAKPELPLFTVNAWNEWTEGAYLLPDTFDGLGRLEALKRAFGK